MICGHINWGARASCPHSLATPIWTSIFDCSSLERVGNLRFTSCIGQYGHRAAKDLPLLRHFFETRYAAGRNDLEMVIGPPNTLHTSAQYSRNNKTKQPLFTIPTSTSLAINKDGNVLAITGTFNRV